MKKLICFFVFCLLINSSFAENFDEYKENFLSEFDTYTKTLMDEFENYKKILDEELQQYKKEIGAYWSDLKISNNKVFVEYSTDKKERKIIDFENNKLIVEVRADSPEDIQNAGKKIENIIDDTISEDLRKAFERDQVSKNVEKKLAKSDMVVTSVVPAVSVLSPYISDEKDVQKIKQQVKSNEITSLTDKNGNFVKIEINLPDKNLKEKVNFVKSYVFDYAGQNRIQPEVIFSIIHNESYFNPLAKSYVPAYGLMQIVPKTAGADATRYLFGKPKILSPSYLYNPSNNILVGTTYFRILYFSYLKGIKDPTSRLYCSIAAYNTGAGNVAKAFVGSYNIGSAVNVINRMSPDDVYRTLKRNLPFDETRRYLDKVVEKISFYKSAF